MCVLGRHGKFMQCVAFQFQLKEANRGRGRCCNADLLPVHEDANLHCRSTSKMLLPHGGCITTQVTNTPFCLLSLRSINVCLLPCICDIRHAVHSHVTDTDVFLCLVCIADFVFAVGHACALQTTAFACVH